MTTYDAEDHLPSDVISEDAYLKHYGILRKSGRYPWGSGGNAEQRSLSFLSLVEELKAKGLTHAEIAKGFSNSDPDGKKFTSSDLRDTITIANNTKKAAQVSRAEMYKAKGYSNTAIGEKMGINESSVRALLAPGSLDRANRLEATAQMLRDEMKEKGMLDVSKGVALQKDLTENNFATAISVLKDEGYEVISVQAPQVGRGPGQKTRIKVLAPPGTEYKDVVKDLSQIKSIESYSDDGGRSYSKIQPPVSVSSKRVQVAYKEDGGDKADGTIYVRPGVKDLDMGSANYAQVRIMVDGTHYIKGMAMYKDDLPDGVDLVFNTNKTRSANKTDALKKLNREFQEGDDPKAKPDKWSGPIDQTNPFGSIVRQIGDRDESGRVVKVTSAMNLVNESGDWDKWSKTLSAQMLSKQKIPLIKERLDETFAQKKAGLDEIMELTNPAIRKKLLESYADDLDSAAVHLKAAGMHRQRTQVILPLNSINPKEIYAPNFEDGERVVLIRYPHGGTFEIPELTVNNRHRPAKRLLGNAPDAVGIHHTIAERLSGADFDGDTVVVIPNNHGKITSDSALKGLEGFNPQEQYRGYEGMPKLGTTHKNKLMGEVSNLITDMTIKGASPHEIAQAVRHSMVVIDAEKHNLNYKQSRIDNNIASLSEKYQGTSRGRASTLISRKKSPVRVDERRIRKASEGGPVDKKTGKKVYINTDREYVDKNTGKTVRSKSIVDALSYTDDAHTLSSGTVQEKLYADYSNKMKDLANKTRLAAMNTEKAPYSDSAARVYEKEVASLNSKLKIALQNSPRERQAQVIANARIKQAVDSNPGMDKAERRKLEYLHLEEARALVGAKRQPIVVEPKEWEAIQAGAIRPSRLDEMLSQADIDTVKKLATPKAKVLMSPARQAKADRLLNSGATQTEVANALGVSLTTLKNYLNGVDE